jgi:hypothetical protein
VLIIFFFLTEAYRLKNCSNTVVFCSTDRPDNRRKSADFARFPAICLVCVCMLFPTFFDFKDSGKFSVWIRRSAGNFSVSKIKQIFKYSYIFFILNRGRWSRIFNFQVFSGETGIDLSVNLLKFTQFYVILRKCTQNYVNLRFLKK